MENRAGGVRGTVLAWGVGGVIFVALVWGLATFFKVRLLDFEHYLEAAKLIGQGQNPYGVVEFFATPHRAPSRPTSRSTFPRVGSPACQPESRRLLPM